MRTTEPLPVSVVIPHTRSREDFFHRVCLPSVMLNNPAQIIVVDREGGSAEKRNEGAAKAKHPYLLFVDDDGELASDAIQAMLDGLAQDPTAAFAYGDITFVSHVPPVGEFTKVAVPWDLEALRRCNYIDVTALMRREAFPGFDLSVTRLQDWDLWLTVAGRGGHGIYIRRGTHRNHRLSDDCISVRESLEENDKRVREKHGIL